MRVLIFLLTSLLFCPHAIAGGDAEAGAVKGSDCAGCHNSILSLKGRGTDTIVKQIKAIRSGEKSHPPGVNELCEDDIADIAAYLDGA